LSSVVRAATKIQVLNPFTADPVNTLHFAFCSSPLFIIFFSPERQSARMSKVKNGGLDQCGAEPFEQQQFGTAGVKWVNMHLKYMFKCILHFAAHFQK